MRRKSCDGNLCKHALQKEEEEEEEGEEEKKRVHTV
jgi:hypothetical protein